jgi:hypothetical protein
MAIGIHALTTQHPLSVKLGNSSRTKATELLLLLLGVYKLTYTEKQYKMEFDYAGAYADRIQDNHSPLMRDASV